MTEASRQDFRLIHRLRVRWAEVDQQRIVFNPHYLMYIDIAFTEYWRAMAIPYELIPQTLGGDLYVKKSTLEYHGSARLDDLLDVGIQCARIGNSSMLFRTGIFRNEVLLVSGELVYVFANPATQTSMPVPQALRDLLQSYESGVSPIDIRLGDWAQLGAQARALRQQVFVDELNIDHGLAYDSSDDSAVHALARNRMGQALATGRLVREGPALARIARVAVNRSLRSTGFGRVVMQALMQLASERGDTRVVLQSQCSVEGFYTRLGFMPMGDPYEEAGIAHIDMARQLASL
ncbi:MAG: YbgC/FadM family acyl-CoA thioesterase [Betaproteobacteria bacterium]